LEFTFESSDLLTLTRNHREINERKRETENQTVLTELRATIVDINEVRKTLISLVLVLVLFSLELQQDKFMIAKIGRALIKQGHFKKITWKGNSFKGSICIFNDSIMVTKAKVKDQ